MKEIPRVQDRGQIPLGSPSLPNLMRKRGVNYDQKRLQQTNIL